MEKLTLHVFQIMVINQIEHVNKDIKVLENILLKGVFPAGNLLPSRLAKLTLQTLEYRRRRGDATLMCKLMEVITLSALFLVIGHNLTAPAHCLKHIKHSTRTTVCTELFPSRTVNNWNQLSHKQLLLSLLTFSNEDWMLCCPQGSGNLTKQQLIIQLHLVTKQY